MIPRLYINSPLRSGANASLSPDQAHYLKNVLRRSDGDEVRLFNADDGEFKGSISRIGKKGADVQIGELMRTPINEPDIWLLFAPIKRNAVDLLAQKATELGAAALYPVFTERTNAVRLNRDRLTAIAIEAAEQSGRLTAPTIGEPQKLKALIDAWEPSRGLIYCDEAGDDPDAEWGGETGRARPMGEALAAAGEDAQKAAILIGPEGGFSPAEREFLRAQPFVTPVTLGPRILRADTAALAALALWQAFSGDFRRR